MDSIIPLGQKNTLAEYIILFGADNRPPMLDKDLYDSWKSRMEHYMQNREHGRMILELIENGPLIWPTMEENGVIRTKKYAELFEMIQSGSVSHQRAKKNLGLFCNKFVALLHGSSQQSQLIDFLESKKPKPLFKWHLQLPTSTGETRAWVDDLSNAQAVLMANISNYGSDVILEVFKEQFDSIKRTRVCSKEQSDSLIDKLNLKSAENEDLKAQIQDKELLVYVQDTCPNAIKLTDKKVAVTPKNKVKKVRIEHSKSNVNSDLNYATCKKSLFDDVHDKWLLDFVKTMNSRSSKKVKIIESNNANHSEPNHTWGSNAIDIPSSSSLVMRGYPDCSLLDSGTTILQELWGMVTISWEMDLEVCMRTRSQARNRNRRQQQLTTVIVEEPEIPMADNRTMAQMLQAPIEGYEDAIVVPPINANNFELKQTLINLVQSNQFTGKQDPHNHLRFFNKVTSTFRHPEVPNTSIKLLLFPFSLEGEARTWLDKEPPRSILTWDDLVSKFINQFFPPSKTTYLRNKITTFYQETE
ncbi:reverse transcriptase domain-containing protein [Tanacetum coccineum]